MGLSQVRTRLMSSEFATSEVAAGLNLTIKGHWLKRCEEKVLLIYSQYFKNQYYGDHKYVIFIVFRLINIPSAMMAE